LAASNVDATNPPPAESPMIAIWSLRQPVASNHA
jgi:hypothetical protein